MVAQSEQYTAAGLHVSAAAQLYGRNAASDVAGLAGAVLPGAGVQRLHPAWWSIGVILLAGCEQVHSKSWLHCATSRHYAA